MSSSASNTLTIAQIIWKFLKWFWLVTIPISAAFYLYIYLNVADLDTLTNGEAAKMAKVFVKDVISRYPFAEQVAKILSKSFKLEELKFNKVINDIIQSLVCYTLIDWLKYLFNVRKDSARAETKAIKWVKLGIIYITWFFLTAYVTNIALKMLFDLLDSLSGADLAGIKAIILIIFLIAAVLVFMYRTKENLLLCFLWTISEKLVFPIITTFLLSLMGYWAYYIYTTSSSTDRYDAVIPILLYLLIAASIDYLKDRTRVGIVSLTKKK